MSDVRGAVGAVLEKLLAAFDAWSEEARSDPLFFDVFKEVFPVSPRTISKCRECKELVGSLRTKLRQARPGAMSVKVNSQVKIGPKTALPQSPLEAKSWLPKSRFPGIALFVFSRDCMPESILPLLWASHCQQLRQYQGRAAALASEAIDPMRLPLHDLLEHLEKVPIELKAIAAPEEED